VLGGYIYTSTDAGITWVERLNSGSRNWTSVASSANGLYLFAVADLNFVYVSSNSGVSWTATQTSATVNWSGIACSSLGDKVVAVALNGTLIYTSTNYGQTWTARNVGVSNIVAVTSSADGTKLAFVVQGGNVHTSTDSGLVWIQRSGSGIKQWTTIASSSNGNVLLAGTLSPQLTLSISSDSGNTWSTFSSPTGTWSGVTVSSDGTKLAAADGVGYIYTYSPETAWKTQITQKTILNRITWNPIQDAGIFLVNNYLFTPSGNEIYSLVDGGRLDNGGTGAKLNLQNFNSYLYSNFDYFEVFMPNIVNINVSAGLSYAEFRIIGNTGKIYVSSAKNFPSGNGQETSFFNNESLLVPKADFPLEFSLFIGAPPNAVSNFEIKFFKNNFTGNSNNIVLVRPI
jgi:hypothetical protein